MYTLMLGQTWPQEVMVSKFSIFRGFKLCCSVLVDESGNFEFSRQKKFLNQNLQPIFTLHHVHYDDVDILPSSSLFDKSYPEFYGYQTLS